MAERKRRKRASGEAEAEEWERRKRGRRRSRGGGGDPVEVLGEEVMGRVMELLDARSVAGCTAVSRAWRGVAANDRLWAPKCAKLMAGKAHIPRLTLIPTASRLSTYSMVITDGKRTRITKEDLCDHDWEFRFTIFNWFYSTTLDGCMGIMTTINIWSSFFRCLSFQCNEGELMHISSWWQLKAAPEYWRNLDPSWKHTGPPMRRYFHPDGYHSADLHDAVWGGHECTYTIITSFAGNGQIRDHYVRINRWPPMKVSRKEDWSWELSNHLYHYNSIPDTDKKGCTGPLFPVW